VHESKAITFGICHNCLSKNVQRDAVADEQGLFPDFTWSHKVCWPSPV
jgi:hypothetical protein